ncbi:MAG: BatD family protein [Gammaproteobacteria bacterium]|nr:BatD family protein [Gammaproteobacteria bacterium]MCF6363986.1 BatD family protein [Gammaproteobacteria bacterium]
MNLRTTISMQNLRRQPLWSSTLLTLLLMLTAGPSIAGVRATLDRNTIYAGDVFTLIIESDGQSSGQQPNLAPLERDFEVLGTSTSTQVSIINGRRSDKTRWHVQLQPRHRGQLRIPPLHVGGQQTAAIDVEVSEPPQQTAAQAGQHVFIETEADTDGKPVYVQQQIPYTIRLYYDDRLREGELSTPEPENAVVERLGEERRYDTVHNGRQYHVIERNYVISAEKSGSLTIPPALFRGRIAVPQQGGRTRRPNSPMEEFLNNSLFANDPFFRNRLGGGLLGNPGQPISIRSRAIDMMIKPRPAASQNWLPAEAISLSDSWTENPPQLKVGEPVSRTITIQAKGLSASQIPELSLAATANARVYPEASEQDNRTDGKTIYGVRTQTLTYIPDTQGTLDVPPITLNWWDIRKDKPASTTLPAWQFNVLPGVPGKTNEAQTTTPAPVTQQTKKASANSESPQEDRNPLAAIREALQENLQWLIAGGGALLALGLLVTALAWRTRRQHRANTTTDGQATSANTKQQNPSNRKSVLRDLEQACRANDRDAAARALLNLSHTYWPDDAPRSLDALATRIEKGQAQVYALDRSLYAADRTDWQGDALWDAFRHGLQKQKFIVQTRDDGLKPLYPNSL